MPLIRLIVSVVFCAAALVGGTTIAREAAVDLDDTDTITRGLEAQYLAVIIREKRLADDREVRLIAEAEVRLQHARKAADTVRVETATIMAELAEARSAYASLVEQIALRDAAARTELEAYRKEASDLVSRSNSERRAALQRFADGDRVGAWPVIEALTQASIRARLEAAQRAADADLVEIERLRRENEKPHP